MSQNRLRQFVVNLGMAWNGFFPFAIAPDVMLPAVAQKLPGRVGGGLSPGLVASWV